MKFVLDTKNEEAVVKLELWETGNTVYVQATCNGVVKDIV